MQNQFENLHFLIRNLFNKHLKLKIRIINIRNKFNFILQKNINKSFRLIFLKIYKY